jgi:purine catabolism regulator
MTRGGDRGPQGQSLAELLTVPVLADADVLAGAAGLSRTVARLNVMEVPDILPLVKPREFLLTTGYPLRDDTAALRRLVEDLDDAGVAGLGVKLGPYLEQLPPAALEAADARGFPLISLPQDRTFDEILSEVLTAILDHQAQRLSRSEQIHRTLIQIVLRGDGLAEICRELSELVGAPTAVVSTDGRILGAARLEEVGVPDPRAVLVDVVDEDTARVGREEVPCAAVLISAGLRLYGHVVAFVGDQGMADHRLALEHTATVAALAITKEMEIQAVEDKYRSDLMHDLLTHVEDREDALRRASGFGWNVQRRLIAIVVRLDDRPEVVVPDEVNRQPALAAALRQLVLDRDPQAAVVQFSHEVVILTRAFDKAHGRAEAGRFLRRLVREVSTVVGATVSAGQSRPVEDLADIRKAYAQASQALAIGREVHGRGAVQHFLDLGVYRLLWQVQNPAELTAFAQEVLGELTSDDPDAASLRRTLEVLLDTNCNIAESSRLLHFHYNTVRHRIAKLESIVGPFMSQSRVRLNVQLALLVLSMRGLDADD